MKMILKIFPFLNKYILNKLSVEDVANKLEVDYDGRRFKRVPGETDKELMFRVKNGLFFTELNNK
jgi:hypothetical protein